MSTRIRNHLRGNVVGYIALFLVLTGGVAYASSAIAPPNSVDSAAIINGEVKNPDLGANSVTSGKILDANVNASDLNTNSVTSGKILDGNVKTPDYQDGSVTNPKLAPDAVTSDKIQDGSVGNADLAPRENVTSPTLSSCDGFNNWTTGAAAAQDVGFWKDRSGVVHLQGSVSCAGNATEGGAIFNLPAGYRPAATDGVVRWAALSGGASISQIAVLDDGSGAVVYDGPDSAAADDYISLDGLTFRAEQ